MITSDASAALTPLSKLEALYLDRTSADDALFAQLGRYRQLRVLHLSGNPVGANAIASLADLEHLVEVSVAQSHLTDAKARPLFEHGGLVALDVSGNALGDESAVAIAKLRSLQTLDLGGTNITAAGLKAVARLPVLRSLGLSHTELSAPAADLLLPSSSLRHVALPVGMARTAAIRSLRARGVRVD